MINSKYFPKAAYLMLIILILLILFNSVNILKTANKNLKEKTISGYAINNQNTTNISKLETPPTEKSEIYSGKSYLMFYSLLIGIVAAVFITFLSLKSTVMKNIEKEDKEREL